MSNIISSSKGGSGKEVISMSNQGTDCFFDLLIMAADDTEKTEQQEKMISFLKDQKDINHVAPGTASFDLDEMPWSKDTLSEDVEFMMGIIKKAKTVEVAGKLDYRPDLRIVSPWLDRLSTMIWKLDKDYIYGTEETETVERGIKSIRAVLCGNNGSAKRRLLFYLDKYLDPFFKNDLTELCEPLKKLLQEVIGSDNEIDVVEEARHLLEAYLDEE